MPRLSWLPKLYENLTYVCMRPAAIVLNYSVMDIWNDVCQIIIIWKNRLVWGLLTLAPIMNASIGIHATAWEVSCVVAVKSCTREQLVYIFRTVAQPLTHCATRYPVVQWVSSLHNQIRVLPHKTTGLLWRCKSFWGTHQFHLPCWQEVH